MVTSGVSRWRAMRAWLGSLACVVCVRVGLACLLRVPRAASGVGLAEWVEVPGARADTTQNQHRTVAYDAPDKG
eukprot:3888121-Prymnesium_polylepis.1